MSVDPIIQKLREEMEAQMGRSQRKQDGGGWLRFPKEKNFEMRVRVLPAVGFDTEEDPPLFFVRFGQHWINRTKYYCPNITKGEFCPACSASAKLYAAGDTSRANALRASERGLVQVVRALGNGQYEDEPLLLELPRSLLNKFISYCLDDEYGNLTDPETGSDFRIIRRDNNGIADYSESVPARKATAIPEDQFKRIMSKAANIHEVAQRLFKIDVDELLAAVEKYLGSTAVESAEEVVTISEDELRETINNAI